MEYKILFLGPSDSPVVDWLRKKGENVFSTEKKITKDFVINKSFSFLISYGYRFILKKEILDLFPDRSINLHISLLPYNRGADPNFWSFIEGTPKGVTIHYLDQGVDTGDIIIQKEIKFVSPDVETLSSSYNKLQKEIQNLFFQNWNSIKKQTNNRTSQEGFSTSHKVKDKDDLLFLMEPDGWNTRISKLINFYEQNKNM
jgi:methionyl-tRNA formyltransferase